MHPIFILARLWGRIRPWTRPQRTAAISRSGTSWSNCYESNRSGSTSSPAENC